MSIHLYASFLVSTLVLIYLPGPVNTLTVIEARCVGWRNALPCVWGGAGAVLLQLLFTALLLNSIRLIDERVLIALRWGGAAYLVYLGCVTWRNGGFSSTEYYGRFRETRFWRGFVISGLNPKTLIFFPSFFPQFIRTGSSWDENQQYFVLASSFLLVFVLGVISMAIFSDCLLTVFGSKVNMKTTSRLIGSLLILMGALMVTIS
jgi:homoserine/homoserine lactone efflux protein